MKFTVGRVVAAGAVVGLLGLGGVGFAYAQSTGSGSSGPAPSTGGGGQAPSHYCPNMDGGTGTTTSAEM
jgi:hypothetical protein